MATTINYPASINSKIWNYAPGAPKFSIVQDESDTGLAKRRLRSTVAIKRHAWDFIFTRAEYEIFQIWIWTNLVGGTLSFNIPWPETLGGGTKEIRFMLVDGEAYKIVRFDKDGVRLSVHMEEI